LRFAGSATWNNGLGSLHTGEVEGVVPLGAGRRAVYRDEDGACSLTLAPGKGVLNARDNGACGGANVTFTGKYRRTGPPAFGPPH
jgi:hypothetical protein